MPLVVAECSCAVIWAGSAQLHINTVLPNQYCTYYDINMQLDGFVERSGGSTVYMLRVLLRGPPLHLTAAFAVR